MITLVCHLCSFAHACEGRSLQAGTPELAYATYACSCGIEKPTESGGMNSFLEWECWSYHRHLGGTSWTTICKRTRWRSRFGDSSSRCKVIKETDTFNFRIVNWRPFGWSRERSGQTGLRVPQEADCKCRQAIGMRNELLLKRCTPECRHHGESTPAKIPRVVVPSASPGRRDICGLGDSIRGTGETLSVRRSVGGAATRPNRRAVAGQRTRWCARFGDTMSVREDIEEKAC
uniref:Uncharacterized protein n=1 Tax=Ananas comosus var. bracteatus TaxID=296719 RepID=A0A6V7P911_ANACO|nr:unnamed protein product [Ananas comosus var. bracteatus]